MTCSGFAAFRASTTAGNKGIFKWLGGQKDLSWSELQRIVARKKNVPVLVWFVLSLGDTQGFSTEIVERGDAVGFVCEDKGIEKKS